MRGLNLLVAEHPGRRLILVAHGGTLNAILAIISKGNIGSGKTALRNASLSLIHYQDEQWEIEYYDYTDHLDPSRKEARTR